jgi:3-oxoacyl-[acyl-carrier-protein] synthase II
MGAAHGEVWITGLGLVSSLGAGAELHWQRLAEGGEPVVDEAAFSPYAVHPLAAIDVSTQIPKRSDLRQMEGWQRIGVFAAGLALDDAGLKGDAALLSRTHIVAAAGNGERDPQADRAVLAEVSASVDASAALNSALLRELRPTLYLGQQSQLLAGNICIVHQVTGASRTYKGEEVAGAQIVEDALRRINAGAGEIFLVGGACNAERWDQLLALELGGRLWRGGYRPVWQRQGDAATPPLHGGLIPGSVSAFLVLENAGHARRRGARPYARIAAVEATPASKDAGSAATRVRRFVRDLGVTSGPLPVISGASGFDGPAACTSRELSALDALEIDGIAPAIRAHGSMLGHALEAHFPAGLALAALALRHERFYPPFDASGVERAHDGRIRQALVTATGNLSGEALALVVAAEE